MMYAFQSHYATEYSRDHFFFYTFYVTYEQRRTCRGVQDTFHWQASSNLSTPSSLRKLFRRNVSTPKQSLFSKVLKPENRGCSRRQVYIVAFGTEPEFSCLQAGEAIFTLPICFRQPDDPGYPLSDSGLREFSLKENHLSIGVTACFIAVAHEEMQE